MYNAYPRRFLDSGDRAGLNIMFSPKKKDMDYICRGFIQGFKIILHTPGDFPRVSKQFYRVPINQEVSISVKPQMMITDRELFGHAPEK